MPTEQQRVERDLRRWVEDLETQLADAKDTDDGPGRDLKEELRQARHRYRTVRSGGEDPGPDAWRTAARDATATAAAALPQATAHTVDPGGDQ